MSFSTNTWSTPVHNGWQARLDLRFAQRMQRTALVQREYLGPLTVQRPFYPEGEVCHVYLLHPPGGVVGGDTLHININAETNSHALLTTPAAGKFYRSAGAWAEQTVDIIVNPDAIVEWLPQETIIYQGAQVKSRMNVNLQGNAKFIGWELFTLGRPASGEGFENGAVDFNWNIAADNKPILIERLRLDNDAFRARWGLQGFAACGTLFAKLAGKELLTAVQALIGEAPNRGVTLIDDILVCRGLDQRCDRLRAFFAQVYGLIRTGVIGKQLCEPRIWAT